MKNIRAYKNKFFIFEISLFFIVLLFAIVMFAACGGNQSDKPDGPVDPGRPEVPADPGEDNDPGVDDVVDAKPTSAFVSGVSECYIDEFDPDKYILTVFFDNGEVKLFQAKKYVIEEDLSEFSTVGSYTIVFKYGEVECDFAFNIKNHVFDSAELLSESYYYDGEPKSLSVVGAPEGTSIKYTGNAQTEVGVYEVTAVLEKQYYETKTLSATLTVEQSTYAVEYVMNIDGAVNPNPSVYSVRSGLTLENPGHVSYAFGGWYTDELCTEKADDIQAGEKGDKIFYAKWENAFVVNENVLTGITDKAKETMTEIVVPEKIDGVQITEIGRSAFSGANLLRSVTLPDSITVIGAYAFGYCSALENISLPSRLTEMDRAAFISCESLTSIDVPDGVTTISESTFASCGSLTSVRLGANVTAVNSDAFINCRKLSYVELPESLRSIGESAFSQCVALKNIDLPSVMDATGIGIEAFAYSGLTEIVIPDGIVRILERAFRYCTELESITFGKDVETIMNGVFNNCTSLTELTFTYNLTWVYEDAFSNCTSLKTLDTNRAIQLKSSAFENCTALETLTLNSDMRRIGNHAFGGCTSLRMVELCMRQTVGTEQISSNAFQDCYRLIEIYKHDTGWALVAGSDADGGIAKYALNIYTTEDGSKVKTDANGFTFFADETAPLLLERNEKTNRLVLPENYDGKTYGIHSRAFSGEPIEEIVFSNGVTSIGDYAFSGCPAKNIVLPDSIVYLGDGAFSGCVELVSIDLGSIESMGEYVFSGCNKLESIDLPDTLDGVVSAAFYNCTSLKNVNFGSGVTYIGSDAFVYCENLNRIVLPENIKTIYEGAFGYCKGLERVTALGVTEVKGRAFHDCGILSKVTFSSALRRIGSWAFDDCYSLDSVDFGEDDSLWKIEGVTVGSVKDPYVAATWLKSKYISCNWIR